MLNRLNYSNLLEVIEKRSVYTGVLLRGGSILDVHFRRNLLEKTIYSFAGICISLRNRGISSNVIIRNVISLYTLEYRFNIFSPLTQVVIRSYSKSKKAKLYYLRNNPAPLSKVNFKYIFHKIK